MRCWTGPWDVDLSHLTLVRDDDRVTAELGFSRLGLHERSSSSGESFWVLVDDDGDRREERRFAFDFGPPPVGRIYDRYGDEVAGCKVIPQWDTAARTLRVSAPSRCFPRRQPLRAQAHFESRRPDGPDVWQATDETPWTDFAVDDEPVTVTDPAR